MGDVLVSFKRDDRKNAHELFSVLYVYGVQMEACKEGITINRDREPYKE